MTENAGTPIPDDDETVIVGGDNDNDNDDATVIVPRGTVVPDDEATVLVAGESVVPDDEATVLVSKEPVAPDDEDTVSVSSSSSAPVDDDDTVIVAVADADADDVAVAVLDDDATVRVERSTADLATVRVSPNASSAVRPSMAPQRGRKRGELRPAPVPSGFGGVPFVASGPGVVSSYRARTLVPPSAQLSAPSSSHAPDREFGGVASVRRQSRLVSVWTITAASASIVLIAGGMFWAVKDLVGF